MGFLLDWLHSPTLEWYRSAGTMSTLLDRSVSYLPFSLFFFTLESFQGYLHYRCLRLAVNRESRIVLFTTRSSLKCTSMVPRSNDKSCQFWLATMHSKSRGQSHLVWEIQKKEKEERRHILWKKLSIHHFRKEKRRGSLPLALRWRILYIRFGWGLKGPSEYAAPHTACIHIEW